MTARRKSPPATAPVNGDATPPLSWNWAMDLGRQQFEFAAEGASTVFRGLEAMRKLQEQAAEEAAARHAAVIDKLKANAQPAELLVLQGELLAGDFEASTRYWQQVAATAFEINSELVGRATRLVETEDAFVAARLLHS